MIMTELRVRGCFGYITETFPECYGGEKFDRPHLVEHVFADGRLLLLIGSMVPDCYRIANAEDFVPSREEYFCCGTVIDAEWHGDSNRALNVWCNGQGNVLPELNNGENVLTDEQATLLYEGKLRLKYERVSVHTCRRKLFATLEEHPKLLAIYGETVMQPQMKNGTASTPVTFSQREVL
jgi:hypothetical protein